MNPHFHAPSAHAAQTTKAMALRLAEAEDALQRHTNGQLDSIVGRDGRNYLLRPAQDDLRETAIRLRNVIDSSADAIIVINRGGVILSQSRAATRVLGYEQDELVGDQFFKYVHQADLATVHCAFLSVIEVMQTNASIQFRYRASNTSYLRIEANVNKLLDGAAPSVIFSMRLATNFLPI